MMQTATLSATGNDRIRPGANMSPFEEVVEEIRALYDEAANWADGSSIESQAQCDALDQLDKSLLAADKRREGIRLEEKRPLDEQVKTIQERHNPIKDMVARARAALNKPRSEWKAQVEAEKRRRAEQAARQAAEERRLAQEAMQASAGDLAARERAEEQAAAAKEAEAYAKREAKRAETGNGLRTTYRADLTDLRAAVGHYWKAQPEAFETLVTDLAAKDVRAGKRDIPGFAVTSEQKAV